MGKYGERIDETTVRFERMLPGPIERVWEYLTDAEKRATWLCGGETESQVGGKSGNAVPQRVAVQQNPTSTRRQSTKICQRRSPSVAP